MSGAGVAVTTDESVVVCRGSVVGSYVGSPVGLPVGSDVGLNVGSMVGSYVGSFEGVEDGDLDGVAVIGDVVGMFVDELFEGHAAVGLQVNVVQSAPLEHSAIQLVPGSVPA